MGLIDLKRDKQMKEKLITLGRVVLFMLVLFIGLVDVEYHYWYSLTAVSASIYWLVPWWAFKEKELSASDYDWLNVVIGTVLFMLAYSLFMLEM